MLSHLFILFECFKILACQWFQFFKCHIILLFLN
ncbi:unnamed protein product [Paramecium octaurelia]|uniref:Uncharacterized protein n=1 Tax=Paramecium octaurelia TaxID=43137 RepID=A0A8S1Y4Y1_PAROT|nr:unnamed protein product [Paramecium octaurelia]